MLMEVGATEQTLIAMESAPCTEDDKMLSELIKEFEIDNVAEYLNFCENSQ